MLGGYYLGQFYPGESGLPSTEANIAPANTHHDLLTSSPVITQKHQLIVDNAFHDLTSTSPLLIEGATLAVDSTIHDFTADNITLLQSHLLAVDNVSHSQMVDVVTFIQKQLLQPANTLHGHSVTNIVLIQGSVLLVNNAFHSHTTDTLTIGVYRKPQGPPAFIIENVPRADVTDIQGYVDIEKLAAMGGITADELIVGIEQPEIFAGAIAELRPDVTVEIIKPHTGAIQEKIEATIPDSAPEFQFPDLDADAPVDADGPFDAGFSYTSQPKIATGTITFVPQGEVVTTIPEWLN